MDELFKYDLLYFLPREREFDVSRVAEAISKLGFSFQDEVDPSMFVICSSEEERQEFSESRKTHPTSGFPMVLLISVFPHKIFIDQFAGKEFFEYSRQFIEWLLANYRIQVTDESGNDMSELLESNIR